MQFIIIYSLKSFSSLSPLSMLTILLLKKIDSHYQLVEGIDLFLANSHIFH